MKSADQELKKMLKHPGIVFFTGAGASIGTGLPLGDDGARIIVETMIDRIGGGQILTPSFIKWPRFEVVLNILETYIPQGLKEIVAQFNGIGISTTNQVIASFLKSPRMLLTTNFDDHVESRLLTLGTNFRVVRNKKDIENLGLEDAQRSPLIIKLHGDAQSMDDANDLGATIVQILRDFNLKASNAIQQMVRGRPLVFVGYSARDPDLKNFIRAIIKDASAVAWIGYGEAPVNVKQLLEQNAKAIYFDEGAPGAFVKADEKIIPGSQIKEGLWEENINIWVQRQNDSCLAQTVATVLLEVGTQAAKDLIPLVHKKITDSSNLHKFWMLERNIELTLRSPEPDAAIIHHYAAQLEELAKQSLESKEIDLYCQSILTLSGVLLRTASIQKAQEVLEGAWSIIKYKRERLRQKSEILLNMGHVYTYRGGDYLKKALSTLQKAQQLASDLKDSLLNFEIQLRRGVCLMRMDRAPASEIVLKGIETIIKEVGTIPRLLRWKMNLAEAQRIQFKFDEAMVTTMDVLNTAFENNDYDVVMNVTSNMALSLICLGDIAMAEVLLTKSHQMALDRDAGEVSGNALYNKGWLRHNLAMWQQAKQYYLEAERIYNNCGSIERRGSVLVHSAWCDLCLGDTKNAQSTIQSILNNELIPKGIYNTDLKLVTFFLDHTTDDIANIPTTMKMLERLFEEKSEQRFWSYYYLLNKLLGSNSNNCSKAIEILVKRAFKVALDTKIISLPAVLKHTLVKSKHDIHANAFKKQIPEIKELEVYRSQLKLSENLIQTWQRKK